MIGGDAAKPGARPSLRAVGLKFPPLLDRKPHMIVAFAAPFVAAGPAGADLRLFLETRHCARVRPTRTREVFIVLVAIFLQPAPHMGAGLMPSKRSTSHFAFAPRARPYGARSGARWLPRGSWRTNSFAQTGRQIARVRCRVNGESGAFWRPDPRTREPASANDMRAIRKPEFGGCRRRHGLETAGGRSARRAPREYHIVNVFNGVKCR